MLARSLQGKHPSPLSFCFVLLLALLLTACGNGDSGSSPEDAARLPPAQETYSTGQAAPLEAEPLEARSFSSGEPLQMSLDDGTQVELGEVDADYQITLQRSSITEELQTQILELPQQGQVELEFTGSLRELTLQGSGDPSNIKPILRLPLEEAGDISPHSLQILRLGDLVVDGERRFDYPLFLPVHLDDQGQLSFIDPVFADGTFIDEELTQAGLATTGGLTRVQASDNRRWVGNVRYLLMSYEKDLNWSQQPRLVRMLPDPEAHGLRRPASYSELRELEKQPLCNLVLLVHGHNDYEQAGFEAADEIWPWDVTYKRRVWDLMYETWQQAGEGEEEPGRNYPLECTAFYEFIYPTFRPIFSPLEAPGGWQHETLGEALGRLFDEEIRRNAQLEALLNENLPFNFQVVAHSMGGLVARAGFRHLPSRLMERFQGFVSWGSPHQGAALYSFRYALTAGHDLFIGGQRLPLQNIGTSSSYQNKLDVLALDTPSKRDMRWSAGLKDKMRYDDETLFVENRNSIMVDQSLELPHGSAFFSQNLQSFNESEGDFMGNLLDNRYFFIYGATSKRAEIESVSTGWLPWAGSIYQFGRHATSIEKGAFLNRLLMKEGYKQNDGAVPVYSQRGEGIWGVRGITRIEMGDIDHEEFYGSEPPLRSPETKVMGTWTARLTYHTLGLEITGPDSSRACPAIEIERLAVHEDRHELVGQVLFPVFAAHPERGDPGRAVERLEARSGSQEGATLNAFTFELDDQGQFTGQAPLSGLPEEGFVLVALLKDGSEIASATLTQDQPLTQALAHSLETQRYEPGDGMVNQEGYLGPEITTHLDIQGELLTAANNSYRWSTPLLQLRPTLDLVINVRSDLPIEVDLIVTQTFSQLEWLWERPQEHRIEDRYDNSFQIRSPDTYKQLFEIIPLEADEDRTHFRLRLDFDPQIHFDHWGTSVLGSREVQVSLNPAYSFSRVLSVYSQEESRWVIANSYLRDLTPVRLRVRLIDSR